MSSSNQFVIPYVKLLSVNANIIGQTTPTVTADYTITITTTGPSTISFASDYDLLQMPKTPFADYGQRIDGLQYVYYFTKSGSPPTIDLKTTDNQTFAIGHTTNCILTNNTNNKPFTEIQNIEFTKALYAILANEWFNSPFATSAIDTTTGLGQEPMQKFFTFFNMTYENSVMSVNHGRPSSCLNAPTTVGLSKAIQQLAQQIADIYDVNLSTYKPYVSETLTDTIFTLKPQDSINILLQFQATNTVNSSISLIIDEVCTDVSAYDATVTTNTGLTFPTLNKSILLKFQNNFIEVPK